MLAWKPTGLVALLTLAPATAWAQQAFTLASPDSANEVRIDAAGGLSYRVQRRGKPVIADSPIGISTDKGGFGSEAATVLSSERTSGAGSAPQQCHCWHTVPRNVWRPGRGPAMIVTPTSRESDDGPGHQLDSRALETLAGSGRLTPLAPPRWTLD